MQTVFISRHLDAESPLLLWAERTNNSVVGKSLLAFTPVRFTPPTRADVWFFYSSRAVEFSINGLERVDKLPLLAAMGPGTAATLEALGYPVHFVGDGDPIEVANQFTESIPPGVVFFPRARQSRRSVQRMLPENFSVLDDICYDNVAVFDAAAVAADVYVFTSPLNVSAYLAHNTIEKQCRVIAIGPSTGKALERAGLDFDVARDPSEVAIVKLLEE